MVPIARFKAETGTTTSPPGSVGELKELSEFMQGNLLGLAGQTIDRAAIGVQRAAQIVKSVHMSGLTRTMPPKRPQHHGNPNHLVDLYEFY
ncbi:hypothetical protein [Paraburkholderia caledonica]|uniref:hypothetical protein n=1 Tax=Paraburkholderia caledonica TaxID=134536 RepID=UPI001877EC3D